jgi:4-methylaminobutanoate oxidase (formaldehyde-forming)
MGPQARKILAAACREDVSNQAFPFGHVRTITIAGHRLRALRVTYVGELGWELHMPIEALGEVFDLLMERGKPVGLEPVGYRALESLRLEKFYRAWGSDITPNDNPFEAGLGWAVKLKSSTHFLGREAMEKQANSRLTKRLAGFVCDDPEVVLLGRETILRNGEQVGYLTSGGFGYTVGKPVGLGYVRKADGLDEDFIRAGRYELVVAQTRIPCTLSLAPLYDPLNARVRA